MAKPPCDIRSLAQAHTESAIKTLAEITRQADASAAARVSAAIARLDRGWGKSTQPIPPDADPLEDATNDELYAFSTRFDPSTLATMQARIEAKLAQRILNEPLLDHADGTAAAASHVGAAQGERPFHLAGSHDAERLGAPRSLGAKNRPSRIADVGTYFFTNDLLVAAR
jgi:hypothetical protein